MRFWFLAVSLFPCVICFASEPEKVVQKEPYVVDLLSNGYTKFDTHSSQCNLDFKSTNSAYCNIVKFKCETTSATLTRPQLFNIKYERNKRYYQFSKFGEVVKSGLIGKSYSKDLISIEEIYLDGFSNSNLRSSFEFKNDELYVLPKINISEEMLRTSVIRIKGTCEEATYVTKLDYPVYDRPDLKGARLGLIEITVKPTLSKPWISVRYNGVDFDFPGPILPNYFCDVADSSFVYFFAMNIMEGWSDLGKGPWGKSGWVNVAASKFFDTQVTFFHEEREHIQFKYLGDGKVQSSGEGYEPKIVPLSDIYEEGKLKVEIDCNRGC